jgi:hypothetical protein
VRIVIGRLIVRDVSELAPQQHDQDAYDLKILGGTLWASDALTPALYGFAL